MSELAPLRHSRAVIASIVVAAIAVAAAALVAVASMLGWLPKAGEPAPQRQAARGGAPLAPGEPLVTPTGPNGRPEPLMPHYSTPTPPPPAPAEAAVARDAPRPPAVAKAPGPRPPQAAPATEPPARKAEPFVPANPARAAPQPPRYAQAEPRARDPQRERGATCGNCGVVSTITTYPGLWEVRVRFDDGDSRTMRFRSPPPFRLGERVRYEDGRLMPD